MSRREVPFVAEDGRDKGKRFIIKEMDAWQGEEWAFRLFLALARSGVELPEDFQTLGMEGVASLALSALSGLSFELAKPLLDDMMACVLFDPDPKNMHARRTLIADDTEEVITRLKLRREVWKLHVDFFTAAARSA